MFRCSHRDANVGVYRIVALAENIYRLWIGFYLYTLPRFLKKPNTLGVDSIIRVDQELGEYEVCCLCNSFFIIDPKFLTNPLASFLIPAYDYRKSSAYWHPLFYALAFSYELYGTFERSPSVKTS